MHGVRTQKIFLFKHTAVKYRALVPKYLRKFVRLNEIVTLLKQSAESLFIHSITKLLVAEPATRNPTTGHAAQTLLYT